MGLDLQFGAEAQRDCAALVGAQAPYPVLGVALVDRFFGMPVAIAMANLEDAQRRRHRLQEGGGRRGAAAVISNPYNSCHIFLPCIKLYKATTDEEVMHLFFTDVGFTMHGQPRPNVPFLCFASMELCDVPNEYLLYVVTVRGRTRSKATWRTYANHLYEYFSFVEANTINWLHPSAEELAAWRDSMVDRGCSTATVNQRLRCVEGFYKWATYQKKIGNSPFVRELAHVRKATGFLAHTIASTNLSPALDLTLRSNKAFPKFLNLKDALTFLNSATSHTVKLMGFLALLTGMRREEVTYLDYRVLPNPAGHDPNQHIAMYLDAAKTPTKGAQSRTVMLPYGLAVALSNYFTQIWPLRAKKYRINFDGEETTKLFLSKAGNEFSLRYLNNEFRKIASKTGIDCHPHTLRHTFGTYELVRVSKKFGEVKALMWVRDRLGHSSVTTTELYVHGADLIRNDIVDGYQTEVLRAMANGT